MSLEELIHDMVKRGEMTHLSLSPYEKQWAVSFCAASPINGYTFIIDDDPVNAIRRALTETIRKQRRDAGRPRKSETTETAEG